MTTARTTGQDRPRPADASQLVTSCGRRIAVKCLHLATPDRPISRVTLDVGQDRGGEPGVWAALTAGEARELAHRLLSYAALAELTAGARLDTPPAPGASS